MIAPVPLSKTKRKQHKTYTRAPVGPIAAHSVTIFITGRSIMFGFLGLREKEDM
jgi:hypothetical protein